MDKLSPQLNPMTIRRASEFDKALVRLEWAKLCSNYSDQQTADPGQRCEAQQTDTLDCLLKSCLSSNATDAIELTRSGRKCLNQLVDWGATVFYGWPRPWRSSIEMTLGTRLYFCHQSVLRCDLPLVGIASSRLGKDQARLPHWPQLIQRCLWTLRLRRERLLMVTGTASEVLVRPFAKRFGIESIEIDLSRGMTPGAIDWIAKILQSAWLAISTNTNLSQTTIWASPPASPEVINQHPESAALPDQDRCMVALADRVIAIHVRKGGAIQELLSQRLADPCYPTGSVYVAITEPIVESAAEKLLDQKAVAWYLSTNSDPLRELGCRMRNSSHAVRQLAAPARLCSMFEPANQEIPYLIHCTRGCIGPRPNESSDQHRDRVFLHGVTEPCLPLLSLLKIIRDRRIIGGVKLSRRVAPLVSFTAVSLAKLLKRRTFQSHLNRWDWEPYGIMIQRTELEKIGATPVIYGNEKVFQTLSIAERHRYQPAERKSSKQMSWSSEMEWRVLGDVWLDRLSRESVMVFVRFEREARLVASWSPWPVIWVESQD